MEEKRVKFELSRLGLIFVILLGLCILVWTFILGVWIGTKIGVKSASEEVALEKREELTPSPPLISQTNATSNATISQVGASNATGAETPSSEEKTTPPKETSPAEVKKEAAKEVSQPKEQPKSKERAKKEETQTKKITTSKEEPKYTKKEVASLATQIKKEPSRKYTIQIGAFSQKDKAQQMVEKAKQLGYSAQIKEITSEGKSLYKVLLGGYGDRAQAEQVLSKIKEQLKVEKPFIVEAP